MSAVTKCDICGKIYKESDAGNKTFNIGVTEYEARTGDYDYSSIDCCPKCTKKIVEFIEVLKSGYEYRIYMKHPLDDWPKEIEE